MTETAFMEVLKTAGPWCAITIFFVWQSWVREKALSAVISKSDEYIRVSMDGTLKAVTKSMDDFTRALDERPCISGKMGFVPNTIETSGGKHS